MTIEERMMRGGQHVLWGICVALLVCASRESYGTPGISDPELSIKSQPLVDALIEWARQTEMQVIIREDGGTDVLTPHIQGRIPAWEALSKLLENTGFMFEYINERTVAVRQKYAPSPTESLAAPAASIAGVLKYSDPSPESLGHAPVTGSRPNVPQGDAGAGGQAEDSPAPVAVFTREMIEELGVLALPDLLRVITQEAHARHEHRAPYITPSSGVPDPGFDSALILINGRRIAPGAANEAGNSFDLNTIPLAAIERIEVLSSIASAAYGVEAIGGVINVILKNGISLSHLEGVPGGAS